MQVSDRRAFLGGLGGVFAFGLGGLAEGRTRWLLPSRLGESQPLDLGRFEALAALLQESEPDALQAALIERLRAGLALEDLVAATALANARSFGGHDYDGYHVFMALMPAYAMSRELRGEQRWLPVLKVVHRNARRIQATGGRDDALAAVEPPRGLDPAGARAELWERYTARDVRGAERVLARATTAQESLEDVRSILLENLDVHRVVLAWRSWDALQLTGEAFASTLMRQPLRFCIDGVERRGARDRAEPELRSLLPALIEEHGLARARRGTRRASEDELAELADVVFAAERADAARAAAAALGSGLSHEDVGEALSIAANRLLLHDPGRERPEGEGKPVGSVHGASVGLHASDAARAWRNLASVSDAADSAAMLIAGAHHTAGQSSHVGEAPYPYAQHGDELARLERSELLSTLSEAVAARDQERAGAAAAAWMELHDDPEPLFAALLSTALEADGALHAEKYYRTVREDAADARAHQRALHLVALARVSASEAGFEAPGLAQARELLQG
ncbi:MAG TPA: hypothetical protein VMT18_12565 [Planctomycetota bacterium]|nr:hypothetical protein [Planctomycetota bacterium]